MDIQQQLQTLLNRYKLHWGYFAAIVAIGIVLLFFFPNIIFLFLVAIAAGFWYQSSQALKESEERWKFALEGAGDGVWDWHVPTDEVIYSTRYKQIHGFSDEDIAANSEAWHNRIHPDDREKVKVDIYDCLEGRTPNYMNEHRICCKDGEVKWVLARGMVVNRDDNNKAIRMIGTHADITERKLMEEKIRQLAHYDSLTGLPNRSLFHDRLQQAIRHAKRDTLNVAVMFIDLDGFKPINDQHGHDIGDQVLIEVAQRLTGTIRTSDTVARLGGDEFVILLANVEHESAATVVADKILQALQQPFVLADKQLSLSASIGIAMYPEHADDDKLLLIRADIAMYYVKKRGKHDYIIYTSEMQNHTLPTLSTET